MQISEVVQVHQLRGHGELIKRLTHRIHILGSSTDVGNEEVVIVTRILLGLRQISDPTVTGHNILRIQGHQLLESCLAIANA